MSYDTIYDHINVRSHNRTVASVVYTAHRKQLSDSPNVTSFYFATALAFRPNAPNGGVALGRSP